MDGKTGRQTSNISKYVNNSLCTNPTTLTLRSLGSDFDKESKSDFFREREGGGGLKPKQYARLSSHFEFTRKRILIKNPNLDFYFFFFGGGRGGGVAMGGGG